MTGMDGRVTTHRQRARRLIFVMASSAIALSAGCSSSTSSQGIQPAMVRGVVTLNGRPLDRGSVTLIPVKGGEELGQPGVARIDPDGSFWIGNSNLFKPAGIRPGTYKAVILSMRPRPEGTGGPIAVLEVPERYTDERTTPFEVVVTNGQNRFRFDLTTDTSAQAISDAPTR